MEESLIIVTPKRLETRKYTKNLSAGQVTGSKTHNWRTVCGHFSPINLIRKLSSHKIVDKHWFVSGPFLSEAELSGFWESMWVSFSHYCKNPALWCLKYFKIIKLQNSSSLMSKQMSPIYQLSHFHVFTSGEIFCVCCLLIDSQFIIIMIKFQKARGENKLRQQSVPVSSKCNA
jgi:hypothetical protein